MARDVEVRRNGQVVGHARVCGEHDIVPPRGLPAPREDYEEKVSTSMDKDKHKAALDALAELIRGELAGEDRARFARVGRLALIGQKLMVELSPRAEDVDEESDGDDLAQLGEFYPPRRRRHGQLMLGAGNDQQQMVRETLAMLGPAMGGLHQQNDARRRESMARELNELIDARNVLKEQDPAAAGMLTKRIDAILAAMGEEEKPKGDEDGLSVVPAVDVRRHQTEPSLGRLNEDDPQWPVADGEGGGAGAPRTGNEPGRAPQVVGHGG